MMDLSELEQDALTEIFNIGVGVAADALYQLVGEQVSLSVPLVELTSQLDAKNHYIDREQRPLSVIRQVYTGEFTTEAILMFPVDNTPQLVRMMAGSDVPDAQIAEMASDALAEIGNIVLNGVMSNLTSTLHLVLEGALPHVSELDARAIFAYDAQGRPVQNQHAPALVLMVDFELSAGRIRGYLAFLLDTHSTEQLLECLSAYIADSSM